MAPLPVQRQSSNSLGLQTQRTGGYSSSAEDKYSQYRVTHSRSGSSYQPQVVYTGPSSAQPVRPPLQPQHSSSYVAAPAMSHSANRYAYVTTTATGTGQAAPAPIVMVPTGPPPAFITTTTSGRIAGAPYSAGLQRVRREAGPPSPPDSHGGSAATRHRRDQSAPPPSTPYMPRRKASYDSDSDDEAYSTGRSSNGYGGPMPRGVSTTSGGSSAAPAPRPIMRKRTTSTSSNASVHFTPDNLFLTFPSSQSLKISNIPKFGAQPLLRAIRGKVNTMWLPGITFEKEGRGEYHVLFNGLGEGPAQQARGGPAGLSEAERKDWGLWTARGAEGIAAIRLLMSLFSTFAGQGFSYLASLSTLPPQLIFTTTPQDTTSRFLAVELSVTPMPSRKQMVPVTDADSGELIVTKKVKVDISHVRIRCVDFPEDVLRALVGAVRNTGRDAANINTAKPKGSKGAGYETDAGGKLAGAIPAAERLEFGVQGERWDTKGVYVLDSIVCRGTGKRGIGSKERARYAEDKRAHPNMPSVIEADTDTLPVLLSHVLKSLSSNGFRLEASVPMPLPVPLVDPFSPFGAQPAHGGGLSSFFNGVLGGDSEGMPRRGYSREAWCFRSVDWFQDHLTD